MKLLRKFLSLHNSDRILLIISWITITVVRLGLWLLPWKILYEVVGKIAPTASNIPQPDENVSSKVAWAVETVSRYTITTPKCLARALTTYILLARQGYRTELCLGVAKDFQGNFTAHAWVESQGQIIIGRIKNLSQFTPLPPLYRKVV